MYFYVITSSLEALYMSCHEISQVVMSCYDSYEHYIKYIKITCFNVSLQEMTFPSTALPLWHASPDTGCLRDTALPRSVSDTTAQHSACSHCARLNNSRVLSGRRMGVWACGWAGAWAGRRAGKLAWELPCSSLLVGALALPRHCANCVSTLALKPASCSLHAGERVLSCHSHHQQEVPRDAGTSQ